jgi:hypothetical protein
VLSKGSQNKETKVGNDGAVLVLQYKLMVVVMSRVHLHRVIAKKKKKKKKKKGITRKEGENCTILEHPVGHGIEFVPFAAGSLVSDLYG